MHKRIYIGIYRTYLYVVSDVESCKKLAKSKAGIILDDSNFEVNAMTIYGNGCNIIWAPPDVEYGTLAHECTHVMMNIFHRAGVHIDYDNQEPTAYLMGYLMSEASYALQKLNS